MEALSIQAVKANQRPAGEQARSGLGDIFQALLRDSVERQEAPVLPPRFDDRPERDAPRRDLSDERVGIAGGDRRDRSYDDVPAAVESRPSPAPVPAPTNDTVKERENAAPRPHKSTASDQPSNNRDTQKATPTGDGDTPAPDGAQGAEEQIAAVSGIPLEPTHLNATAVAVSPITGSGGQANTAAVLPGNGGASSKSAGAMQAAAPAANQAQNPASSQSAAPGTGTAATPTAPASGGGNGFSVQVTVTPAQLVATPNAGLGGGAASAAIAAANAPGLVVPATANTGPGTGATADTPTVSATTPDTRSSPGAGRQTGAPPNAQIAPTDGQAQSASIAATGAKQDASPVGSETRTGTALNSPLAKDAPVQNTLAETAPARPTQNGQTQGPGGVAPDVTGQNATGQGDGSKATNGQNQQAQSAPQIPTGQAANATVQAGGATAPVQGPRAGEPGATGGSTGSTDAASSRAASVSTVATGGFTQTLVQGPDTLGSLTRSGGTHPTAANQVAVEIQKAVSAGKDQIRIRLHPAELGQIDVSLKVRHDGTVKAIVTIDRPETFDLMQRDARGLERALQDAGLKTDSGSLSFNLRGGDQQAPSDGQRGQGLAAQPNPGSDRKAESPPPEADAPAPFVSDHALDIRV